jgi:hypothetical protein
VELPVKAINRAATFSNLSINKTGAGYMLNASSGTPTGATSVDAQLRELWLS